MQQFRLFQTIYRMRRVIAAFVLLEWLYKAHKSKPVNYLRRKKIEADHKH